MSNSAYFLKSVVFCTFFSGLLGGNLPAPRLSAETPSLVNVILDTDMSGDCDDVGALAILNKFADSGEAKILACVANGHDQDKAIAASLDAINTYYGRPHLPVGTYQGPKYPATKSPYTARLRAEFPHTALADDREPKAVDIYRATLAAADDRSVTIISIGFLVNLAELLQSQPDSNSPLTGSELVRRKVKQLVVMGGRFPKSDPNQGEYNFAAQGGGPDTRYVMEHWPTPILFSGFEIGETIRTGTTLAILPSSDPVRRAYELYTNFKGRPSWDLTAVLAAIRNPNRYWGIESNGNCKVNANGSNEWEANAGASTPERGHSYLLAKVRPSEIAKVLDDLLTLPPKSKHEGVFN